jgi:hypothetical protein
MTHREFVAWLAEIERQFPVAAWRIDGICVWPLVRLSLYAWNFHASTPGHSLAAGRRRLLSLVATGLACWARASVADRAARRPAIARAEAVFLSYSIGVQGRLENRRYNPLTGPYVDLAERAGLRTLVWETSPFGEYNVPRYTPSALVQPTMMRERLLSQVLPLPASVLELQGYDAFLARVEDAGLTLPHRDMVRLRRDVLYLRRQADTFARWLRRVRPHVAFVADTGLREQALCLACRELGIMSVEIQHGVQGEYHPSYGSWSAVPPTGYETRARVFWCWDRASAEAINRWAGRAPDAHLAIIGGDPWREMWARRDDPLVEACHRDIDARKHAIGGTHHVLVTLSSNRELLPAPVAEAIGRSPAEWRYWIRLHPVDQATRRREACDVLPQLGLSLDLMDYATALPLHALLREVDCHVTVGLSTVIREAEEAGVGSVSILPDARELFPVEVARGTLAVAETGDEVIAAIRRHLAHPIPAAQREPVDPEAAMRRVLALAGLGPASW